MNRLFAFFLLCCSLLLGTGLSAQAQHGRGHHGHHGGHGHYGHGPRYHHEAPYRSYGGRNYYRPRSGPAIVIRP